jgi:hypothetical protein
VVVVERAGDQPPMSPDAASTPKIDVGWALTHEIVESARSESVRVSKTDPDGGGLDDPPGDVSGDAEEDIDHTT